MNKRSLVLLTLLALATFSHCLIDDAQAEEISFMHVKKLSDDEVLAKVNEINNKLEMMEEKDLLESERTEFDQIMKDEGLEGSDSLKQFHRLQILSFVQRLYLRQEYVYMKRYIELFDEGKCAETCDKELMAYAELFTEYVKSFLKPTGFYQADVVIVFLHYEMFELFTSQNKDIVKRIYEKYGLEFTDEHFDLKLTEKKVALLKKMVAQIQETMHSRDHSEEKDPNPFELEEENDKKEETANTADM